MRRLGLWEFWLRSKEYVQYIISTPKRSMNEFERAGYAVHPSWLLSDDYGKVGRTAVLVPVQSTGHSSISPKRSDGKTFAIISLPHERKIETYTDTHFFLLLFA